MNILGDAIQVTQEQLRKAMRKVIGDKNQVTVRPNENTKEFYSMMPRNHFPVSDDEYRQAAEAEVLEWDRESPQGFTIWRKGTQRQPVPAMVFTQGVGFHLASDKPQQAVIAHNSQVATHKDPQKEAEAIASEASAFQNEQRKAGYEISISDAVNSVIRRHAGKNQPDNVAVIVDKARQLVSEAAKAGLPMNYCDAVRKVMSGG